MILIDLGNTKAKIFADQITQIESSEIFEFLNNTIEDVLICSVVPKYNHQLSQYSNVRLITSADYQLMFEAERLTSKGADRIIAGYGAIKKYGKQVVVVDIGTCVTIDVLDERNYISGFIFPGFSMLENVLATNIDQLPTAKYGSEAILTENQIYWANIYGFIGAVKNLIAMAVVDSSFKVIITGGTVAKLLEEHKIDLIAELAEFKPTYDQNLIQSGMVEFNKLKKALV